MEAFFIYGLCVVIIAALYCIIVVHDKTTEALRRTQALLALANGMAEHINLMSETYNENFDAMGDVLNACTDRVNELSEHMNNVEHEAVCDFVINDSLRHESR